jgi:hypothetical protein
MMIQKILNCMVASIPPEVNLFLSLNACNFDLLLSFPNIGNLPHFLRIYKLSSIFLLCTAFW